MDATVLVIAVVVVLLAGAGVWFVLQQRRRRALQEHFGPEYARTVEAVGDRTRAEKELAKREERVRRLEIRPLSPEERARFGEAWRQVQARFVDSPSVAVAEADRLVVDAMQAKGYPVSDFEQRAADVSVDHPDVVENYRAARLISERNARGEATTEELRQAMVHYRALFEDLLEPRRNVEVEVERAS